MSTRENPNFNKCEKNFRQDFQNSQKKSEKGSVEADNTWLCVIFIVFNISICVKLNYINLVSSAHMWQKCDQLPENF